MKSWEWLPTRNITRFVSPRHAPSICRHFRMGKCWPKTLYCGPMSTPPSVAGDVRRTLGSVLKTIPVARITALSDQVDATIVTERLIAALSELFGGLGSLLAAIGLYGLLAYTVARRITEIGIRMALGATPGHVIRMVF